MTATPTPTDDELAVIWRKQPWGVNAYRAFYDAGIAAGRIQALEEAARETLEELAHLIEPFSGIGLANGATRADIAHWLRARAAAIRTGNTR